MEHLDDETADDAIEGIATYQAVLPYNDGEHERSHAENIISLTSTEMTLMTYQRMLTLNQLMLVGKKAVCKITDRLTK